MDKHKVRVWVQSPQSPQSPASVGHPPGRASPTCQVQVESQKQVHAEVWQLLCGVQWKAILNDA